MAAAQASAAAGAPRPARDPAAPGPWRRAAGLAAALAVVALAGSGCAPSKPVGNLFSPYRLDIAQGNYLTRETVEQLQPGMSRDEVRFVLGSPLLTDAFHPNRWDYVFRFQHGNGNSTVRRVTVHFENDRVARIDADALPGRDDPTDPALPRARTGKG